MTAVAEHPVADDHVDHGEHEHPSDATYLKVGAVLAALTALEVSTYWWPTRLNKLTAVLLIVMMVIKFATVAAYFMHLKFDAKVLRRVFVAGLVLAVCVYVAALSAFVFWDDSGTAEFNDAPRHREIPPPPTVPPVKTSRTRGALSPVVLATTVGVPAWQPHPEVWILVAGIVALGLYVARVIQPLAVESGAAPLTPAQKRWFVLGVAVLWLASDWPIHDIAEDYLYSIHMVQHLLITLVVPPVFLLATPEWLARLILGEGRSNRLLHRLARPVPAALLFNVLIAVSHWTFVVNNSVTHGWLHFSMHTVLVATALLAWMPVCGPLPELRMGYLSRGIYLFLMSVIPTIPGAWLTASSGVLYEVYNRPERLWSINVLNDQQAAGVIMKLGGGTYLWILILLTFIAGVNHEARDVDGRRAWFRGTFVPTVPTGEGSVPAEAPGRERGAEPGPDEQDGPGAGVDVVTSAQ